MDDLLLVEMRETLTALRDELQSIAQSARESAQTVELDQQRVGRLSRMDAMQAQAMALESGRRREASLRSIAAALVRLDNGEYGNCQTCDEAINESRLRFDPAATQCVSCASAAEQKST